MLWRTVWNDSNYGYVCVNLEYNFLKNVSNKIPFLKYFFTILKCIAKWINVIFLVDLLVSYSFLTFNKKKFFFKSLGEERMHFNWSYIVFLVQFTLTVCAFLFYSPNYVKSCIGNLRTYGRMEVQHSKTFVSDT